MKHLRKFDSVADLNAAIANSTIGMIGLAYNNGTPVMKKKEVQPTPPAPDPTTPFYIEDISGSENTVQIKKDYAPAPTLSIQKSTDGTTWESMGETSTTAITATIPANGKLYLRCSTTTWIDIDANCNSINTTGNCKVGGNIMSLLYGSNFTGNETTFPSGDSSLYCLFYNNTHLVNASDLLLPATTLAYWCYNCMFSGCTALTSAPALPATTLAESCYGGMFYNCTALTTAPALPATTLTKSCYGSMFNGCSSLTWEDVPELPATTLAEYCYVSMFQNNSNMLFNSDYEYDEWCTNHIPASANYDKNTHGTLFDIGGIM